MAKKTKKPPYSTPVKTPYFEIYMAGKKWSPLLHSLVQSVTFVDSAEEASTATILISDPDFILLDDNNLVRSTKMKIYGGYVNNNKLWLEGFISTVDVSFPDTGPPQISIMVMDESFAMDNLPRYDLYKNLRSDQIAKKIALLYGFKFVGDKGPREYKKKVQSKQTDIKFLQDMAQSEWFIVRILNGTLYWLERKFRGKNIGDLWYRRPPFDVINFNPRLVQADRLDGTVQSGIDTKTGKKKSSAVSAVALPPESDLLGKFPGGGKGGSGKGDSGSGSDTGNGQYMQYDPETGQWNLVQPGKNKQR